MSRRADDAFELEGCEIGIIVPGSNILKDDLNCGGKSFGIGILVADVYLDCQGNKIKGKGLPEDFFGIAVSAANRVTVSNCEASGFIVGLVADSFFGPWTDLTVRGSTFNKNTLAGMIAITNATSPAVVNVVDSRFEQNGDPIQGAGIATFNVGGTIVSSTMNKNKREAGGGFAALEAGEIT
jgi:hypothetical protein